MLFKIKLAKCIVKFGSFLQESPVYFLRPKELIDFGRIFYSNPAAVSFWASSEFVDAGLFPGEIELYQQLPKTAGHLLLLGLGGGREAIFLAKAGYRVTGVDFVPEMVERSLENARQRNVELRGRVQELSDLDFPPGSFDVVWFSCSLYSAIPGKKARIGLAARAARWLADDGCLACFFYWNPSIQKGKFKWAVGKLISWISLGNLSCEKGDFLKNDSEFLHAFSAPDEVASELAAAGFEVVQFYFPQESHNAGVLMRRKKRMDPLG